MSKIHFSRISNAQASSILEPIGVDIFSSLDPHENVHEAQEKQSVVMEIWTNALSPTQWKEGFPDASLCMHSSRTTAHGSIGQGPELPWAPVRAFRMRSTKSCLSKMQNVDETHYRAILFPSESGM